MIRSSGLLLHVTSLPTKFGIGDLGPAAWRFVDTLVKSGQTWWQMLPLCPVGLGNSPYASPASFAGNPLLISPEILVQDGWVPESKIYTNYPLTEGKVDYQSALNYKIALLHLAYDQFVEQPAPSEFQSFIDREKDWLIPYAAFQARKTKYHHQIWTSWPDEDHQFNPSDCNIDLPEIQFFLFEQFIFDSQWHKLSEYCHQNGVKIMGDLPIYVAHDSVDVWAHPELFQLDDSGEPLVVAGVPPDLFSDTGQRWGNPIYQWDTMHQQGYQWWVQRMKRALSLCDSVRLDHFRGFAGYWQVPASEETAVHGRWVTGPGQSLFDQLSKEIGAMNLIAEDLGVITPDVIELMNHNGFPGMAVIQFGFDAGNDNLHLPHNYRPDQCIYSGTHDNNTLLGWWHELSDYEHGFAKAYLHIESSDDVCPNVIERCMHSDAGIVIVPVQDVLSLDSDARMNFPGTLDGNWEWALTDQQLTQLKDVTSHWLNSLTTQSRRFTPKN